MLLTSELSVQFIVAPRYNEDPIIMNNIWKPSRITVKYVETNPAITKSPRKWTDFDGLNAQFTNNFVLLLAVSESDMMIQMVDEPNTTLIGQDRETLNFKALLYI